MTNTFEWPSDTVFIKYGDMLSLLHTVVALRSAGHPMVIAGEGNMIAMSKQAAALLGMDKEDTE